MEEKKRIDIQDAGIDADVLEDITKEDITKVINDPQLLNRAILNAFAECLSEMKKVAKCVEHFQEVVSLCAQEKLLDYFGKLNDNVKEEEKRMKAQEIIHKDHKKSSKK